MPRVDPRRWMIAVPAVLLVTLVLLFGTPLTWAQERDEAHPAHIHDGSCETLGEIAVPLNDVAYGSLETGSMVMGGTPAADTSMGTPMTTGEIVGSASGVPLKISVTLVDLPLEQIADGQHAINVHQSAEEIDVYIACGDIGGQMLGNMLVIGIGELNDSEQVGIAVLQEMGDQTQVAIVLQDQEVGGPTAGATPPA
jgi:hypothetical protein